MHQGTFKIINWNVAGAKFLQLKSAKNKKLTDKITREDFKKRLNNVLFDLIDTNQPEILTLQEVVRYDDKGREENAKEIIDKKEILDKYDYYPEWLIDTHHLSAPYKWNKVKKVGKWSKDAFFAQGNAVLIRNDIKHFPIFHLPGINQIPQRNRDRIECVKLESGFYFGDRNTEPRAAIVVHVVISELRGDNPGEKTVTLKKPLDIFIVNVHLTTLQREREGIPEIDDNASEIRFGQLDIITNGMISRYNKWVKDDYTLGRAEVVDGVTKRHKPIWIIAGDLNFTRESREYGTLVSRGFIDLIPNHDLGTKTSGLGKTPTLTVDYVFAGPRFEAMDPSVVEEGIKVNHVDVTPRVRISDHFPLIVDVPIGLPSL